MIWYKIFDTFEFVIRTQAINYKTLKPVKIIAGIAGAMLVAGWLVSLFLEYGYSTILLIGGIIFFGLVFLPLHMLEKNMKAVSWENFKNRYDKTQKEERHYRKRKGFDSSSAPYRKSDSGLRWEGGNIYGANAKRGRRRSFLKRR